jgi:Peptidase family M28
MQTRGSAQAGITSPAVLDPRIYRAGFVVVALAVIVVAFSLVDQSGPFATTLAPDAFNGQNTVSLMNRLAHAHPNRRPGSAGDYDVAAVVKRRLHQYGYRVSTSVFSARTVDGRRSLETVLGSRVGLTPGSIVIVSHRDALSSPAAGDLSGTATMLELARALAGETQHHTLVLASVSGSAGFAGARQLARSLPKPVDAVIALGDVAGTRARDPVLIPWSTDDRVAPTVLRNTVAAALRAQAALKPGGTGPVGQLAHLAFPMTLGEQAPFAARGIPAVTVSLAGDRRLAADEAVSADAANGIGRAVLQSVDAIDGGSQVSAATPYLLYSGKIVPGWAIRVLALALLVPVFLVTLDGVARVRRRRYRPGAGSSRALTHALPFMGAALVVVIARLTGILNAAPPGPVAGGEVPLGGGGIATIVVALAVLVGGLLLIRWLAPGRLGATSATEPGPDPGHAIGTLALLCLVVLAIWVINPFAALFAVPAVHLWLWLLDPELRPHPVAAAMLLLLGLAPAMLLAVEYASTLSLSAPQAVWNGVLLVAAGQIAPGLLVCWCLLLGCLTSVVAISVRALRQPRVEDVPVTVRGPVTYAGPGSLGGTESALRR